MLDKVFIRGNSEYGDKIIKYLINLGAKNSWNCKGTDIKNYYYINPINKIVGVNYNLNNYYKEYKEVFIEDILNFQKNWWW